MKKYLVIGNPIKHSLSPLLHNHWIKKSKIDAIYEKKNLESSELKDLFINIKQKKIEGINVTIPFKKEVIPFLDVLSPNAEATQSVNTISLKNDKIVGDNTDIDGFELSIKNIKFDLTNKKVFLLGAGGVVPSIIFALKKMNVKNIVLSNRTKSKAENIKNSFEDIKITNWGDVPDFDIVINATSLGLNEKDEINLSFPKASGSKLFYDIIYNPKETNFLKQGKKLGYKIENGEKMFVYQAAAAFNIWNGKYPEIDSEVDKLLEQ